MIHYNYEVVYHQDDILKTLGLEERGKIQQFIANQVLTLSTPYVPFDIAGLYETPGRLRDSGRVELPSCDVVWSTPYARRLYYHPEYNYQGAPLKGAHWVGRAMQNGGLDKITQGAQALVAIYARKV